MARTSFTLVGNSADSRRLAQCCATVCCTLGRLTPGLSCARKRERGTSGRCKRSAAHRCSAGSKLECGLRHTRSLVLATPMTDWSTGESVFSTVKRKLSAKAPGHSTETQRRQATLLGVAYNIYLL
jgi:hypothetical protein